MEIVELFLEYLFLYLATEYIMMTVADMPHDTDCPYPIWICVMIRPYQIWIRPY